MAEPLDKEEFRRLAVLELDAVYRLAYHLAARADQVDDLVQETYLRALRSRSDFYLTPLGLRPYLFKVLHNVVHTRYRVDGRQASAVEDLDAVAPAVEGPPDGPCPDDLADLDWDSVDERLKAAIQRLPWAHREVFLLCAVNGLRYREIAEVVDVPLGTVMSRLHRARRLLMAELRDLAAEHRLRGGGRGSGKEAQPDASGAGSAATSSRSTAATKTVEEPRLP